MKISIITVCYNAAATLEETIFSVAGQTYNKLEYIIVDGNSKDNTLEIIKKHEDKITSWNSEPDNGLYDAMNKGIQSATGDIVGILNSDDLYQDLDVIADVMKQFNDDPDLDILYGNLVYVKSDDTDAIVRKWKCKTYYDRFFENGNVPPHPTLFVKRSVYNKVGLFNLDYKLAADYELMLRMLKKYDLKIKYIDRLIVKMRLGGATNQSFTNIINQNKEILRAWKNNSLKAPFYLMPIRIFKRLIQFI